VADFGGTGFPFGSDFDEPQSNRSLRVEDNPWRAENERTLGVRSEKPGVATGFVGLAQFGNSATPPTGYKPVSRETATIISQSPQFSQFEGVVDQFQGT
jgi:hypothetical protein